MRLRKKKKKKILPALFLFNIIIFLCLKENWYKNYCDFL